MSQPTEETSLEYKRLRNECTRAVRREKKEHITTKLHENPSSGNIWKIVNGIVNPSTDRILPKSISPDDINQHFISKIINLRKKIDPTHVQDPLAKLRSKLSGKRLKFSFQPTSSRVVMKIIRTLKNTSSAGHDEIQPMFLKLGIDTIAPVLTYIINWSLSIGKFPTDWKLSRICPIYKKGNHDNVNSFRPISCLSIPGKILETVAKVQIVEHFEKFSLFSKSQHGFRKHRSTTSALLQLHTTILNAIDRKLYAGVISFDLCSAFDAIDRDILCSKLEIYGFDKLSVKWVYDYLLNRRQYVQWGNSKSSTLSVVIGAPQGSVLSPVLYIITTADIDDWITFATIAAFADDKSATATDETLPGTLSKLEHDSKSLLSFFASNNLPVNDDKTTFILFGPDKSATREQHKLSIGNAQIPSQPSVKILGVTLSNNCSWNDHLDELNAKLNYRLYILRHLRNLLPQKALQIVAEGIFTSQIRYCLPLFFRPRLSEQDPLQHTNTRLQKAQNEMTRTLYGLKISDKTNMTKLRAEKNILSVNQMLCLATLCETRKITLHGTIPSILSDIQPSSEKSSMTTRSQTHSKLRPPKSRLERTAAGFNTQAVRIWNKLPSELRAREISDARFQKQTRIWILLNGIP